MWKKIFVTFGLVEDFLDIRNLIFVFLRKLLYKKKWTDWTLSALKICAL